MFRLARNWLFVLLLSLLLGSSLTLAKGGGKKGNDNRPPGWDKGEKKGWQSDVPRGLEKKGELGKDEERLKGKAERTAEEVGEAKEREQERVREKQEEMKERAKEQAEREKKAAEQAKEEAQEQAEKEKKEAQRVKKEAEEKKVKMKQKK